MSVEFLAGVFGESPWVATAAVALLAVIGALIVHRVGQAVLRRATARVPVLQAVGEGHVVACHLRAPAA